MKALCWHGKGDVRIDTVPDPKIEEPRDAIVKVTSTAICGSDLHLLDGFMPTMKSGDVLGHEFMGEVVEVGRSAITWSCHSPSPAVNAISARRA
jgi:threonine dehydrogenase-like Zn-dependent dehydrogenase